MRKGTGVEADYWALGVLIFELLVGEPPFKSLSGDPWDTFRQILSGRYFVPHTISPGAADLIYKLLQVQSISRLVQSSCQRGESYYQLLDSLPRLLAISSRNHRTSISGVGSK